MSFWIKMEFSGDRVWCPPVFKPKHALHALRFVCLQNVPALYNPSMRNISDVLQLVCCCCFQYEGIFSDGSLRPWLQNWAIHSSAGTGVLQHSWDCFLLLGTPSLCSQPQSRWFLVQSCSSLKPPALSGVQPASGQQGNTSTVITLHQLL